MRCVDKLQILQPFPKCDRHMYEDGTVTLTSICDSLLSQDEQLKKFLNVTEIGHYKTPIEDLK